MADLSDAELDAIEVVANAAVEWNGGEWRAYDPPDPDGRDAHWVAGEPHEGGSTLVAADLTQEDADFMGAANPVTVLALIGEIRRLRAPALSPREEPVPHACGPNRDGIGEWWLQEGPKVTWTDRIDGRWVSWSYDAGGLRRVWEEPASLREEPRPVLIPGVVPGSWLEGALIDHRAEVASWPGWLRKFADLAGIAAPPAATDLRPERRFWTLGCGKHDHGQGKVPDFSCPHCQGLANTAYEAAWPERLRAAAPAPSRAQGDEPAFDAICGACGCWASHRRHRDARRSDHHAFASAGPYAAAPSGPREPSPSADAANPSKSKE